MIKFILLFTVLGIVFISFIVGTLNVGDESSTQDELYRRSLVGESKPYKINSVNNAKTGGNPHHVNNDMSSKQSTKFGGYSRAPERISKRPPPETRQHLRNNKPDHRSQMLSQNELEILYRAKYDNFTELVSKKGKIYYTIFAGRKEFMQIHFRFTDILLARSLVDEVHVWDFCHDRPDDRSYLQSFVSSKRNSSMTYRLFQAPESAKIRYGVIGRGNGYLWESFYEHYSTSSRYRDEDILVKADDDIVYMDLDKFQAYLDNIRTPHVYFPNIVNNDAGLFLQGARHAHPHFARYFQEYEQNGTNFATKFSEYYSTDLREMHKLLRMGVCPLSCYWCSLQRHNWDGGLFLRGDVADAMHEGFLQNITQFVTACANQSFPRMVALRQRISINMYAARMPVIRRMFSIFLNHQCCDDEGFMGKWPSLTHWDHLIDSWFTIVHFGFNMQYDSSGKPLSRFIPHYDALSKRLYQREFGDMQ